MIVKTFNNFIFEKSAKIKNKFEGAEYATDTASLGISNSSTNKVDIVLIAGLDERRGYKTVDQQIALLKEGAGQDKKVKGFRWDTEPEIILEYLKQNPKPIVVTFSAGCTKSDEIAKSPYSDKNKIWIVECYAKNGNKHVVNAVEAGVPANHVLVGREPATGVGVVKGAVSSGGVDHWDALRKIGAKIKSLY